MSAAITLNGLRVVSLRILQPWRGVPLFDVDLDPDDVTTSPTAGAATITIASTPITLTGFVDPLASGSFVAGAKVRVLAGAGGWSKNVPAQHFHSDALVLSTAVYQATAGVVGETVIDLAPETLGADYVRSAGRASRVLDGVDWWVDPASGVTTVGPRPPATPDPSLEIMSWDPLTKTAEVTCDALIVPGTILVDPRIGESPVTIRTVEQFFGPSGVHATCWCSSSPVDRLQVALTSLVRELAKTPYLKDTLYRFVGPAGGPTKAALQAVDRDPLTGAAGPMPDLHVAQEWTGVAGVTAKLPASLQVSVRYIDGDPTKPIIVLYSTLALPSVLTADATQEVNVGPSAPLVALGGGAQPVVPMPWATALATALTNLATSLGTAATIANVATAGTALKTALGLLPAAGTTVVKAT